MGRKKAIFISYRRADSAAVTSQLYTALAAHFGSDQLFRDLDSIPLGTDFRNVLVGAMERCDVCLVVIGRDWLTIADDRGNRRLASTADFVRQEVEQALDRGIPVIPLLVGGAGMPGEDELPDSLKRLAFSNAAVIRDGAHFEVDLRRLIKSVDSLRVPRGQTPADKSLSHFLLNVFGRDPGLKPLGACVAAVVFFFLLVIALAIIL